MKENESILIDLVREQIAIGVSVAAKCKPCFHYHLKEARKLGLTDAELGAILKVARKVRAVADQTMDEFVIDTLGKMEDAGFPADELERRDRASEERGGCKCLG